MNIQIDVDGVLANFTKGFYREANKYIPSLPIQGDDTQESWDYKDIPDDIQSKIWQTIKASKTWWYELDPIPTPEEFEKLQDLEYRDGINIYYVTARPGDYAKFLTERWIRTHCRIEHPTVIVALNKGEIAKHLKVDFAIEDRGENAEDITRYCRDPKNSFLINRKYNRRIPYAATRVDTFGEFLEKIRERANL